MPTTEQEGDGARIERIQLYLDYWVDVLRLTDWDISWLLVKPKTLESMNGRAIAQISFTEPYHKVYIQFDREMVDGCSEIELERCVIHELCHMLTYPIREVYRDYCNSPFGQNLLGADETVADIMAGIFFHYRHPEASMAPYEPMVQDDQDCEECHPKGEDDKDGAD